MPKAARGRIRLVGERPFFIFRRQRRRPREGEVLPLTSRRADARWGRVVSAANPNASRNRRDWRVILQLASRGPLTNRELSAMVGLDAANITRVVQNLNELGYVTTRTSATDRRKQIISLTAEGAAAHDAIAPQRKQVGEALLECFSPEEAEQFFNFLDRLEDHLQSNVDDDEWIE